MLHTVTKQWRYINFFFTYLHYQTNEYIFEGMNSTISTTVFLVDDCLIMKNNEVSELNLDTKSLFFPLFLIVILDICQFNFVRQNCCRSTTFHVDEKLMHLKNETKPPELELGEDFSSILYFILIPLSYYQIGSL